MKKSLKQIFFLSLFFISIFFASCLKIETIAKEPRIEFKEFIYKDSLGFNHILNGSLRFYFEDGDGNIGFGIDSLAENTVFVEKYKIINGIANRIELNEDIINYKIPKFSTSGNRKALKGDIIIENLDETFPLNTDDTLMYKFYIKDRDNNKSNIDSSNFLILKNYIKQQ